ncbi:putative quorum-sensing-regulated virulence factor [Gimesia maris]|uniref:putative quorum-sensing-regulated virulence factor n=1 Tax=Gimesia maris TaxID=122 RepID=UPI0032EADD73
MNTISHDDDYVLTFGKHKGMKIKDVPPDYLNWIMRTISSGDFSGGLADTLRSAILQLRADDILQEDKRSRARRRKTALRFQRGRGNSALNMWNQNKRKR